MISYVIVGSGYRSEYFGRIARTYPHLFRALFLCRSAEKARQVFAHTGVPATIQEEECFAFRPDFVVVAVDRGHMAQEVLRWARKGFAVLAETPLGCTWEELNALWAAHLREGARIISCEQYHRVPMLAAGLAQLARGRIGKPSSLYISLLHDYHAASLIRRALQLPVGTPFRLRARRQVAPLAATDSREGAVLPGVPTEGARDIAHISFASGEEALYDFCPVQYRSFLYSRHLTVRGSRGEWSDTALRWLDEDGQPRFAPLGPDIPEPYRCLDTQLLRDKRRDWQYALAPDTLQDEYAIATLLLDMAAFLTGGPAPYPLEEALEDAAFWLLLTEALAQPEGILASRPLPWHASPAQ